MIKERELEERLARLEAKVEIVGEAAGVDPDELEERAAAKFEKLDDTANGPAVAAPAAPAAEGGERRSRRGRRA